MGWPHLWTRGYCTAYLQSSVGMLPLDPWKWLGFYLQLRVFFELGPLWLIGWEGITRPTYDPQLGMLPLGP
jgi:hypothetical protein